MNSILGRSTWAIGAAIAAIAAMPNFAKAGVSECLGSFSSAGSFFTSKTVSVSDTFPTTSSSLAYRRVYVAVAKNGYVVTQADKDAGVITAAIHSVYTEINSPFNIVIEAKGSGSRVSLTHVMAPGTVAKNLQGGLCALIESAGGE